MTSDPIEGDGPAFGVPPFLPPRVIVALYLPAAAYNVTSVDPAFFAAAPDGPMKVTAMRFDIMLGTTRAGRIDPVSLPARQPRTPPAALGTDPADPGGGGGQKPSTTTAPFDCTGDIPGGKYRLAMDFVRWERHPRMRRPVLIAAFEGWNDAGDAASSAVRFLVERWEARPFATLDPEEFYDFTVSRPQVRLDDASLRRIEWPANQFSAAAVPGTGRDVIFLVGVEPQLRWRTFCAGIVDIVASLGTELAVTLGALLTDVPHTRPPRITGTTATTGLARELGMEASSYEGPTGIVGALHDALSKSAVASASLWATVPHYVHQVPSPKATRALVERVALLLESTVDTGDLGLAAGDYEREVSERVDADPEISAYVHDLEQAYDLEHRPVPGVDNLAAEAERFLRDQRDK